jgi:hypothetical protein
MRSRDCTLDQFVPAEKIRSMAELDKEEEKRVMNSHKQKVKRMGVGIVEWLEKKMEAGAGKRK